ncbi:MAG TPA: CsbD family protein [Acetobacteraceae bacterium]|nr:CsbD family protein [Acetobacteraceae bacterium]
MNKDQVKGAAREVVGKVQQQTGKIAGSKKQQVKGLTKQISGKLQKSVGDAREVLEDAVKNPR